MGTQYELMTLFADGGWMMYPLVLCSLVALGVIIAKAWTLMIAHRGTVRVLHDVEEAVLQGDLESAFEIARAFLTAKYATYAQWGQDKALPGNESFDVGFEELAEGRFVLGGPEDVVRDLQRFKDLGVTHFSLRFGWPGTPREVVEGTMRLAAAEVFPALR
ncbi:MAG: hypothetical protein IIA54_05370 [Chloroflexi bacterium]|nr:hypothetical protein [Chloroflexota bacterium]